jgi:hypothetical protein
MSFSIKRFSVERSFLALLSCLFLAHPAYSQSDRAQISGFVKDPTGAVVPKANVTIQNEATRGEVQAKTNESGYYAAPGLAPGLYTISVEAPGFKRAQITSAHLDAGINMSVNVDLKLGVTTESVQVTADASAVQSETATVGKLVTQEQVQSLELNGRSPLYLAQLVPGVVRGGAISSFSYSTDDSININGSRLQENSITVDGAPAIRVRANGTSIVAADVDATQEVQVLTADYLPEYGRSSGGQIRIVTKSGTSQFHGTAYEYLRNSALDANSWSRNASKISTVAPFRFNQFGYMVSGPVLVPGTHFNHNRNKLFFLFSQEFLRYRQFTTATGTVPSAAMRTGNFSELLSASNIYYGKVTLVKNPLTGVPYPNNIIPASQLSPNGLGLLSAYPSSNITGQPYNWIDSANAPQNQLKDTVSVDYQPTDRNSVRLRYQHYSLSVVTPFGGNFNLTPEINPNIGQTGSVNDTWTLSPTVVNEFLATVSYSRYDINIDTSSGAYNRSNYGINYPYIFPNGKEIPNKIPTISMTGLGTLDGTPYPAHSGEPIYTLSDNITKIAGNHSIKAGFTFERAGENDFDQIQVVATQPGATNNQNGSFIFTDTRTGAATSGVASANAALGLFDSYGEIGPKNYTIFRSNMFEYFVQDSWKATSKLRIEFGVRHSLITPYSAEWRNESEFDPAFYSAATAPTVNPKTGVVTGTNLYDGLVIPGSGFPSSALGRVAAASSGLYSGLFHGLSPSYNSTSHLLDIQPRAGIAWSFLPKTVFRAGAGSFVARAGTSDTALVGGNPPFQPSVGITDGSVDNPGGTGANNYPLVVTSLSQHLPDPIAYAWNATLERELPFGMDLTAGYVGRRGVHLQRESNINQLQPGTLQANPGVNTDSLRPYQGYNNIILVSNDSRSIYNSMQLNLTRRFSHGLAFGFAYTYSRSYDWGSNKRDVLPNAYNAQQFYGPSDFDTPSVMVANYVYDLPFFAKSKGFAGEALGGWQLSGTIQAQSGTPLTVSTSNDYAGVGAGSGAQIWNINGAINYPKQFASSTGTAAYWFTVTNPDGTPIFTAPAAGTFTTQSNRHILRAPGFQSWNAALMKTFKLPFGHTDTQSIQFRFEAFDFPNHPDWSGPSTNPTNLATFGKVLSKADQRNLQVSLRYRF